MKGTLIFGSVQVFQILFTVLRGKVVAIFLGPAGSGIAALFTSTTNIITQFSSLGLGFSAVRDISQANESGDIRRMSRVAKVFRRWVWITGFLAGIISIVFARQFSEFAFNNTQYTWAFIWLSISLMLTALATGETTLLQGTRQLQFIAKASVTGSFIGLLTAVPLYYFFKLNGIVPGIIVASLSAFIINRYFARKIKLENSGISIPETLTGGRQMVKLGIILMASQVIGTGAVYILNAFISKRGGVTDVGLFQSANYITDYSLGLVFNSIAMDYFPRLSAIADDTKKLCIMVNQQSLLVTLIITPFLIGLIIFAPLIVRLLLSAEYLPAIPVIQWISLGMIMKSASYILGYISFAKGDKKTFFWFEGVFGNFYSLMLNIAGYTFWGIQGLGVSFLSGYTIYMVLITILVYRKYDFRFNKEFFQIYALQILFCLLAFFIAMFTQDPLDAYSVGGILLVSSISYSWYELDKRMDIKNLVYDKIRKKTKIETL